MIFLKLDGKEGKIKKAYLYRIDWNGSSLSKVQKKVKNLLYNYWNGDIVYEELPVLGTRMTFDFYNASKRIVVEVDGKQHYSFNKHFHSNSRQKFLDQLKRDDLKHTFCELNKINLVRIREDLDLQEQIKEAELDK